MSEFYNPKPLITVQRYCFYSHFQQSEEFISTFVAGTTIDNNLRDRLVCGVTDQTLWRKLLTEKDLMFQRAFELTQSHDVTSEEEYTLLTVSSVHS